MKHVGRRAGSYGPARRDVRARSRARTSGRRVCGGQCPHRGGSGPRRNPGMRALPVSTPGWMAIYKPQVWKESSPAWGDLAWPTARRVGEEPGPAKGRIGPRRTRSDDYLRSGP
jgi:hypothetical protein